MQKRILAAVLIVSFVSLLFASNANAQAGTMIASPDPIKLGEQIAVIWGVKDLVPGSWIGMFLAAPNSNVIARQDANPTVDGNGKGGVLYFTAVTPGQIQFRFFQNGQMYMNSNTITVLDQVAQSTSVPFGGGPKAQPTVAPSGASPWQSARQSNVDGGVNLSIVCANLGYSDVVNIDNTANGWRCKNGGTTFMLDWDSICRNVYGSTYHGEKISNAIDGYRCQQGQSIVNPTIVPPSGNNTSSGSGPTNALGQLLQKNADGDYIYPKAGGSSIPLSGPWIHVPSDINLLYLRTTTSSSDRSNIIGTMTAGHYYPIQQTSGGWVQVNSTLGVGWVSSSYVEFGNEGNNPQPTQPPQVPSVSQTLIPTVLVNGIQVTAQPITSGSLDLYQYCKSLGYQGLRLVSNDPYGWRCVSFDGKLSTINLYNACDWQYNGKLHIPMYSNFDDPNSLKCYGNGQLPDSQYVLQHLDQLLAPIGKYLSSDKFYRLITDIKQVQNLGLCLPDFLQLGEAAVEGEFAPPPSMADDCQPTGEDILGLVKEAASNKQANPGQSHPSIASMNCVNYFLKL